MKPDSRYTPIETFHVCEVNSCDELELIEICGIYDKAVRVISDFRRLNKDKTFLVVHCIETVLDI